MPRVAVILSGCGYLDGAEIREAVITLLALDRAEADVSCFAPNIAQRQVVDHQSGETVEESRNVLRESARIARGKIAPLSEAKIDEFDAVVLPGGFGAALNLSSFAIEGPEASIDESVASFLKAAHGARKPIGAICIAPALVALALGPHSPLLTIGNDAGTAAALTSCGARHADRPVDDIVIDEENRIVSTPAYMFDAPLRDIATGIEKAITALLALC